MEFARCCLRPALIILLSSVALASVIEDDPKIAKPKRGKVRAGRVEASDAALIFDDVWMHLSKQLGGETQLTFPKEILWLNGAPGAGKSTNTKFIQEERSILAEPLVVSSLLLTPEFKALKDQGYLVGDKEVTQALFEELMDPKYQAGVVVDGYPRTDAQADICRMLHDRLLRLHRTHVEHFTRPIFRIVVLYIDEPTSIERQLSRGREVEAHNAKVNATGRGELQELRATDLDEPLAARRYKTFIEKSYAALQALGGHFIFNLIDAMGSLEHVRKNIEKEMVYQSTIELNPETFDMISDLELASEVTMNARQRLVKRMDGHVVKSPALFADVVSILKAKIYPVIHQHAISGECSYVSHDSLFHDDGLAVQMAIDILSERGFRVTSEPVVRGTKFSIKWTRPEKLGSTRLDSRMDAAARATKDSKPKKHISTFRASEHGPEL